jgi:hypothetical protein
VDSYQVFVPSGLLDFVPEGQTDSSQAVYCLGSVRKKARPVRDGVIKSTKRTFSILCAEQSRIARSYRPYGTARLFKHIPGNKLPGYYHLVPSGQKPLLRNLSAKSTPHQGEVGSTSTACPTKLSFYRVAAN